MGPTARSSAQTSARRSWRRARTLNATQIVLGATRRSRFTELTRGSVINRVIRDSGVGLDVHVISRAEDGARATVSRTRRPGALPRRRVILGFVLGAVGLPAPHWILTNLRTDLGLPSVLLLFLLLVVVISAVGGVWPALTAAVVGFLLVNWYFTPPVHTFTVEHGENLLALSVFLAVAAVVSGFVSLAARRAADGARARAEAEALAGLGRRGAGARSPRRPAADSRSRRRGRVSSRRHRLDARPRDRRPRPGDPVRTPGRARRHPCAHHRRAGGRVGGRQPDPRRVRARDHVVARARGAHRRRRPRQEPSPPQATFARRSCRPSRTICERRCRGSRRR